MTKRDFFRVYVSQEDIRRGVRSEPFDCPIAIAARRVFEVPDEEEVSVTDYGGIELRYDDTSEWWSLPPEARRFIQDFDEGRPVAPFAFHTQLEMMER